MKRGVGGEVDGKAARPRTLLPPSPPITAELLKDAYVFIDLTGHERDKLARQLVTFGAQVVAVAKPGKVTVVITESRAQLGGTEGTFVATARAWQAVNSAGRKNAEPERHLDRVLEAGAVVLEAEQVRAFLSAQLPRQLAALASPRAVFRPQPIAALLAHRPAPPAATVPTGAAGGRGGVAGSALPADTRPQGPLVVRLSGAGLPATEHVFQPDKRGSTVPQLHPNPPPGVTPFWRQGELAQAVGRKPAAQPVDNVTLPQQRGLCELCNEDFMTLADHVASAKHQQASSMEWRYRLVDHELG